MHTYICVVVIHTPENVHKLSARINRRYVIFAKPRVFVVACPLKPSCSSTPPTSDSSSLSLIFHVHEEEVATAAKREESVKHKSKHNSRFRYTKSGRWSSGITLLCNLAEKPLYLKFDEHVEHFYAQKMFIW